MLREQQDRDPNPCLLHPPVQEHPMGCTHCSWDADSQIPWIFNPAEAGALPSAPTSQALPFSSRIPTASRFPSIPLCNIPSEPIRSWHLPDVSFPLDEGNGKTDQQFHASKAGLWRGCLWKAPVPMSPHFSCCSGTGKDKYLYSRLFRLFPC